jgi:Exodeoxyribonuclease I subunit D (EC 3.1.11.1)
LAQYRDAPSEPPVWLDIEITSDEYLHDIQRKIQVITDDLPVDVLLVRRSREQRQRILDNSLRETLSELEVEEVFQRRLALETIEEPQQARLKALFDLTVHSLDEEPQP